MENNNNKYVGPSFLTLLGIAFIVLKLIGKINWPWIWVLAPIWGSWLLVIIVVGILIFLNKKY